jgi:dTDP-glucose pyrophosphorylase
MINIDDICLKKESTILEAMKVIQLSAAKIVLVVDSHKKLLGTITDGDIRRGLIDSISVNEQLGQIMNAKPTYLKAGYSEQQAKKIFQTEKISQFPVVNAQGELLEILLSDALKQMELKKNTVVLMAGGLGSRLGELTADCPKPMLKVGGKPMLEILLENLKDHGFKNFLISVNFRADVIEDYFKNGECMGLNIQYLREKERMGTAGSLSFLKPDSDLPFLVMNGDVLTKVDFSSFLENHSKQKCFASMCIRKYDYQIPFGVVQVENNQIVKLEEKPIHSSFVSAGIYALNAEAIGLIPQNTYFDMPNLFNRIIEQKKFKTGVFPIHEYWLDVGQKADFNRAQIDFKKIFA